MKRKSLITRFLLICLLFSAVLLPFADAEAMAARKSSKAKTTVRDGWTSTGRYYKKGTYLRGWQTIGNKTYFFSRWGHRKTGIQKIRKKYYFFKDNGVLLKTSKKVGAFNYYLNDKGHLEAYGKGNTWYWPSGRKMTAAQQLDCITFRRARRLVKKITSPSQSQSQKLYACFMWVKKHPYITRRSWSYTSDWPARYANDLFLNTGGCCRSDAAALAYMMRAIGFTDVYVCQDGKTSAATAWVQLNGRVYDTLFSWRANGMTRFYGGTYSQAGLYLDNKQKVAVGFE